MDVSVGGWRHSTTDLFLACIWAAQDSNPSRKLKALIPQSAPIDATSQQGAQAFLKAFDTNSLCLSQRNTSCVGALNLLSSILHQNKFKYEPCRQGEFPPLLNSSVTKYAWSDKAVCYQSGWGTIIYLLVTVNSTHHQKNRCRVSSCKSRPSHNSTIFDKTSRYPQVYHYSAVVTKIPGDKSLVGLSRWQSRRRSWDEIRRIRISPKAYKSCYSIFFRFKWCVRGWNLLFFIAFGFQRCRFIPRPSFGSEGSPCSCDQQIYPLYPMHNCL